MFNDLRIGNIYYFDLTSTIKDQASQNEQSDRSISFYYCCRLRFTLKRRRDILLNMTNNSVDSRSQCAG